MTTFNTDDFLADADVQEIDWVRPPGSPTALTPLRVNIGFGSDALEVAFATSNTAPKMDDVRRLWSLRWNRRAAPVLLVVAHQGPNGWKATVCGPSEDPAAIAGLDLSQVDRICAAALGEPTAAAAKRTLQRLLVGPKDQLIAGLTNQGLFASHELRHGVPKRPDWTNARETGKMLLGKTGADLIHGLGYETTAHGSIAQVLSTGTNRHALAVLLNENEIFERPGQRFGSVSPVTQGLALAQEQNLHWLIVIRGSQLRLYPAKPDIGVGRKGQSETFVELDLALLSEPDAGYLPLLFAPAALEDTGTVASILAASVDHATALGARLRDRVYLDVVPALAVAVANAMKAETGDELTDTDLHEAYHRTLIILFRLLFVSYAEDRGLLPYQRNPRYTRKALKTLAREFTDNAVVEFDPDTYDRWEDLISVWRAVDDGNREWDVPAYNGGLFAADEEMHPSGHAISRMRLSNAEIGPALKALLIDTGNDGDLGPVDFRSLSVREFGTIYEGLLESSLSVAPNDLTVDPKTKSYLPAKDGSKVTVRAGQVYFHNASGARKATGSYFTKAFAVEHLLDTALEPALTDHLAKVQSLLTAQDEAGAGEKFFDFRVADLAMGSGHFLVAAIDRIENRFAKFLTENPIPAINDELTRLNQAANDALGDAAADVEIEPSTLLRRQIARRCIYGLDLNLMAVELARLGIWIHTFVPGLPMSSLDHGLRVGNSLTGMGTVDEALSVFEPKAAAGQNSLFADQIHETLRAARDRLLRVAKTAEATKSEVREASRAHATAMKDAAVAKTLLDAAVAIRLGEVSLPGGLDEALGQGATSRTQNAIERLNAVHLPFLFPEVFMREKPGFDVVLGNPPWEKVRWEPAQYWVGISPGLIALPDKVREAKITELRASHPAEAAHEIAEQAKRAELQEYFKRGFTLRGGTHLEFAQLMLERALKVLRSGGHVGLVLPRQSMVLAGWKNLRRELVTAHDLHIVQGRNQAEWIFDDVHQSYAVVLIAAGPRTDRPVAVWVATSPAQIRAVAETNAITLSEADVESYSDTHVIPWFVDSDDRQVFDKMRVHSRLAKQGGWITGKHDARWDFRGTGPDRALASHEATVEAWKVLMTAHVDAYAFDKTAKYKQFIDDMSGMIAKRRGLSLDAGIVKVDDTHPLVLLRHPSRSDDTRTMIATALPETGVLHNKGYVHAVAHQSGTSEQARLALLGLMNTNTLDWWSRRFVDRHVTAPVVNQLPIPDWSDDEIEFVADRVALLLLRNGYKQLAGGIDVGHRVSPLGDLQHVTNEELLVQIEVAALSGYGLTADDFKIISNDFSEKGMPPTYAQAVTVHRNAQTKQGNRTGDDAA
ncbi:Eco57I restriction-modification methylase domain-containing protein [Paeniglutamicibacter sp.]|uniref:Eco57I restriction-modification methylase domain-containing protein n=1 Tax=Paeniglutamicibacter sp. TaxID=1934391 RepID=UPI003988E0DC